MLRTLHTLILTLITTAAAPAQPTNPDRHQPLQDTIARAAYGQFWGAVLVTKDNKVLLSQGFGIANQQLTAIDADSLFELASVTKSFTAAAILRLEMQGKLTTDDPISKHLADVPKDKAEITIHQLLTHTSGIGEGPRKPFSADDREIAVKAILAEPLNSKPGDTHTYSNAGYWLLAAIVERVSGAPFDDFLRTEVLDKAGMTHSACQGDPRLDRAHVVDRVTHDRRTGDAATCPYAFTWGYRGSGGVVTSANDMIAWDRALRADQLLAPAQKEKMFKPGLDNYGYGWFIETSPLGRVAKHTGGVAGFAVSYTRWLDKDASILVMTNEKNNPTALSDRLCRVLFPELEETISVILRPKVHGMDEHGMSRLPDAADFEVQAIDGRIRVLFKTAKDTEPPIELTLSKSAAARLATDLRTHAQTVQSKSASSPIPPIIVEIYTGAYKPVSDAPIKIEGEEVALQVQPGTPHAERDSKLRVTLIVQDPAHNFWPVFMKLGADTALDLSRAIQDANK
jgi:CubicO group peptidase (beta-lactamase class C family)